MSPIAKYAVSRVDMYTTWKACYDAVRAEVPELAVGVMDAGEGVWSVGMSRSVGPVRHGSRSSALVFRLFGCVPSLPPVCPRRFREFDPISRGSPFLKC